MAEKTLLLCFHITPDEGSRMAAPYLIIAIGDQDANIETMYYVFSVRWATSIAEEYNDLLSEENRQEFAISIEEFAKDPNISELGVTFVYHGIEAAVHYDTALQLLTTWGGEYAEDEDVDDEELDEPDDIEPPKRPRKEEMN